MNLLKPFLIRLLKRSDYRQILGYVVEAKTGSAKAFHKVSQLSISEATENIDWLVTIAQQTTETDPPKPAVQIL